MISKFYKKSNAYIIVYSIADKLTFDHVDMWFNERKNNTPRDSKSILVGNKLDLGNIRQVSKEEVLKFTAQWRDFMSNMFGEKYDNACKKFYEENHGKQSTNIIEEWQSYPFPQ